MTRTPAEAAFPEDAACDRCELATGRRNFIRTVAASLFGIAGVTRSLAALPVEAIEAGTRSAETISYPMPAADGAQIDHHNDVILVRWSGSIYAFNLSCPHQNTALRWIGADHRFECPKHHSKYRPDGTFISGRATRGMDRFPLRRDGDNVVVDVDHLLKETDDAAAWRAAFITAGA